MTTPRQNDFYAPMIIYCENKYDFGVKTYHLFETEGAAAHFLIKTLIEDGYMNHDSIRFYFKEITGEETEFVQHIHKLCEIVKTEADLLNVVHEVCGSPSDCYFKVKIVKY